MEVAQAETQQLLVVTEHGFGKRTEVAGFPRKHRATGGVIANSLNRDTGDVAAIRLVGAADEDEEVMLITQEGQMIRTVVAGINRYHRASRGVTIMRLPEGDRIVSMTVFVDDRPPGVADDEPLPEAE
ncbi:MAG: DNA gyrase subunit A, partial [Chloroflexi bacterium]|nr:DNA gyrase subunit A [Chloroflexota bacterium]